MVLSVSSRVINLTATDDVLEMKTSILSISGLNIWHKNMASLLRPRWNYTNLSFDVDGHPRKENIICLVQMCHS